MLPTVASAQPVRSRGHPPRPVLGRHACVPNTRGDRAPGQGRVGSWRGGLVEPTPPGPADVMCSSTALDVHFGAFSGVGSTCRHTASVDADLATAPSSALLRTGPEAVSGLSRRRVACSRSRRTRASLDWPGTWSTRSAMACPTSAISAALAWQRRGQAALFAAAARWGLTAEELERVLRGYPCDLCDWRRR